MPCGGCGGRVILRAFSDDDAAWVRDQYRRWYVHQFPPPEFRIGYYGAYTALVGDRIIACGGVRPQAECMLITDQDVPLHDRFEAFAQVLALNKAIAGQQTFNTLHAVVHTPAWRAVLERGGFQQVPGTWMRLEF